MVDAVLGVVKTARETVMNLGAETLPALDETGSEAELKDLLAIAGAFAGLAAATVPALMIIGVVALLVAATVAVVAWWPAGDTDAEPDGAASESSEPAPDVAYDESRELKDLCDELDWASVDEIVDIEQPISDAESVGYIDKGAGDAWDANCRASNDPPEGAIFALIGVAVQDTAKQAAKAYSSFQRLPPLPIGSRDQLNCTTDKADWQEGESCTRVNKSLYIGAQRLVRDDNLLVVAGIVMGGDQDDEIDTDEQREAMFDKMIAASGDLAGQARDLVTHND